MRSELFLLTLAVLSCSEHKGDWYGKTKQMIIEHSESRPDSVTAGNSQGPYITESYYKNGSRLLDKMYSSKVKKYVAEIRYGDDSRFELRREIYPNGQIGFEGIFFNGQSCGISTWRHSNGALEQQGQRYKDKKFGTWTTWDENGTVEKIEDFGQADLLDSLAAIKYNR